MVGNARRAVSNEMRKRIIDKSLEGISAKDITIILNINYKTEFRIIKISNSTGRIEAKGQGGNNRVRVIQNSIQSKNKLFFHGFMKIVFCTKN